MEFPCYTFVMDDLKSIEPEQQDEAESVLRYIKLIDFLSKVLDKDYELVLFSFRKNKKKGNIIAIRNGYISGRKLGDEILPEGLFALNQNVFKYQNAVVNYDVHAPNGNHLICSSLLTRDEEDKPICLFNINRLMAEGELSAADRQRLSVKTNALFDSLVTTNLCTTVSASSQETPTSLGTTTKRTIHEQFKAATMQISGGSTNDPSRLSVQERISVVAILKQHGVFQLRDAVTVAADYLKCSTPTIYRYLQQSNTVQNADNNSITSVNAG